MAVGRVRGKRITGAERDKLAKKLLKEYKTGKSVRQLAVAHEVSIGRARNLLIEAGVEFRPKGGRSRAKT